MTRAYFRTNVGQDEHDQVAAEARLAGYKLGEYTRILLREGREVVRKRGIRRGDGLHFIVPGGGEGGERGGETDPGTTTSAVA
jgi:hypothetical protein